MGTSRTRSDLTADRRGGATGGWRDGGTPRREERGEILTFFSMTQTPMATLSAAPGAIAAASNPICPRGVRAREPGGLRGVRGRGGEACVRVPARFEFASRGLGCWGLVAGGGGGFESEGGGRARRAALIYRLRTQWGWGGGGGAQPNWVIGYCSCCGHPVISTQGHLFGFGFFKESFQGFFCYLTEN